MSKDIRNDDAEFAQRLAASNSKDLKYIFEERQWIAWRDGKWATCNDLYARANRTSASILDEAKDPALSNDARQKLSRFAAKYYNTGAIKQALAQAQEALGISVKAFDDDKYVINCKNGLVDLRTAKLIPHDCQLVLKQANASFDQNATCPRWERFLSEISCDDQEWIRYVRRALGYSMTGLVKEQKFFIAQDIAGDNGKTTLFETVLAIIGDYGRTTEFSTFLNAEKTDTRNREAIGLLKGIRLSVSSETNSTKNLNTAQVKRITGGDTLTGGALYCDAFQFSPTFKVWLLVNHLPGTKDNSEAFWRRPVVIPFRATFKGSKQDKDLRDKLNAERDGIFKWLVQAACEYLEHGLGELPKACKDATAAYRADNDVFGQFAEDCMPEAKGERVGVQEAFEAYVAWKGSEADTTVKFFSDSMVEVGLRKSERTSKGFFFLDRKLRRSMPEASNDNIPREQEPNPLANRLFGDGRISSDMRKILGG